MKKIIELKHITKSFDGEPVLKSIDLDIYDNEFITLLGPSGCGKTTLLRLIGGFETPTRATSSSWARRSTTCRPTSGT